MYEKRQTCDMQKMPGRLECFEISSDPQKRLHMSVLPESREEPTLYEAMDKFGAVIGLIADTAMIYLLIVTSHGITW